MTTHVCKVVGSNPGTIYWTDFFHIVLLWRLYCLFEKTENKWKRGQGWPIFLKKIPTLESWLVSYSFLRFPQTPTTTTKSLTNFDQGNIFNQLCRRRRRRDVFWRKSKPKKDISYPHDVSSLGCFNWWQSIKLLFV